MFPPGNFLHHEASRLFLRQRLKQTQQDDAGFVAVLFSARDAILADIIRPVAHDILTIV